MYFYITERSKVQIRDVQFVGNTQLTDDELRTVFVGTKRPGALSNLLTIQGFLMKKPLNAICSCSTASTTTVVLPTPKSVRRKCGCRATKRTCTSRCPEDRQGPSLLPLGKLSSERRLNRLCRRSIRSVAHSRWLERFAHRYCPRPRSAGVVLHGPRLRLRQRVAAGEG